MFLEELKNIKMRQLDELLQQKENFEGQREKLLTERGKLQSTQTGFIKKLLTQRRRNAEALNISAQIKELDREIKEVQNRIWNFKDVHQPIIENATTIHDLGLTLGQAIELMKENNITPKFESREEALTIAGELAEDAEFMRKAIRDNPRLIVYDKTNDKNLYIEFIDLAVSMVTTPKKREEAQEYGNKIKSEILEPRPVPEGQYKFKPEQIFEAIRGYVEKDAEKTDEEMANSTICDVRLGMRFDGTISKEDGEQLEEIWKANTKKYMHYTTAEIRDLIFSQGLRGTKHGQGDKIKRALQFTAAEMKSFFEMISYGGIGGDAYILSIPKNAEYIWGSKSEKGDIGDCFILPEYIAGLTCSSREPERKFQKNDIPVEKREKYKYVFKEGSTVGHSKPIILDEKATREE